MNAAIKMPAPADVLDAAQDYARRGFAVVPLYGVTADGRCGCGAAACDAPGAHPIGGLPRWVRCRATPAQLRQVFGEHAGANVGIPTGAASGVVAVEVHGQDGQEFFPQARRRRAEPVRCGWRRRIDVPIPLS